MRLRVPTRTRVAQASRLWPHGRDAHATRLLIGALRLFGLTVTLAALLLGCEQQGQQSDQSVDRGSDQVVVYTALDRQFSEPILADFTAQTGLRH
jgi:hypothetical protein